MESKIFCFSLPNEIVEHNLYENAKFTKFQESEIKQSLFLNAKTNPQRENITIKCVSVEDDKNIF